MASVRRRRVGVARARPAGHVDPVNGATATAPAPGPTRPPIAIIGTGALAMRFGALLARAGHAVTLAGTWADGLRAMGERGIEVVGGGEGWFAEVGTFWIEPPSPDEHLAPHPVLPPVPPTPLILVLVKSHQTARIAPFAARLAAADGLIVTLQNGLGNGEALTAAAGADRVAVGITTLGASVVGPGRVRFGGDGTVAIGRSAATAARVDRAVSWLRAAGIDAAASDDIAPAVWRKLAVNCAINPLSALLGVPNGALVEDDRTRAVLRAAAAETAAVAAALGIALDGDVAAMAEDVARRTAANRSSMLQDVDRGAPTEIDAINGAVVRAGETAGVATPVNRALWRAVVDMQGVQGGGAHDGGPGALRSDGEGDRMRIVASLAADLVVSVAIPLDEAP
ncbi:MAG: 2-dehydropantoate 2-reductase [Ardenticatenales bacterium]